MPSAEADNKGAAGAAAGATAAAAANNNNNGQDQDGGESQQRVVDPRCAWFEDSVLKNLKIKSEKYKKMLMFPDCW